MTLAAYSSQCSSALCSIRPMPSQMHLGTMQQCRQCLNSSSMSCSPTKQSGDALLGGILMYEPKRGEGDTMHSQLGM